EPVHLRHGSAAQQRRRRARDGRGPIGLCRSAAAVARPHRHRHRFRHDRTLPRRAARLARPHGHRPRRRAGTLMDHLAILPIVLPLFAGALLVLIEDRHHTLKLAINAIATLLLVIVALLLLAQASAAPP